MSTSSKRRIVQLNGEPSTQAVNEALRQICEMIYALEGRTGPVQLKDSLRVLADQRKSPLRLQAAGRRGSGAIAFGSTENSSLFLAKGAYLSDSEAWVAEDTAAVILELSRDSSTPRMFRNTGLSPGQIFQPTAVGWIAIGGSTGDAVVDLSIVQARSEKDQPSGYAGLDAGGEISVGALPDSWEDLKFPAQGINIAGLSAPPSRNADTGLLEFSGTVDNAIAGVAQMPHQWKEGSTIYPHLHLRFPTTSTNSTRWKFEYSLGKPTGEFSTAYGSYTDGGTITVTNPNSATRHVMAGFNSVPMVNTGEGYIYPISTIVMWRVSRLSNSDGADNDTSAVALLEFDIHYEVDSLGSQSATAK